MFRNEIIIAGIGESDIGKVPELSGLGLNAQATKRALDDAGMKLSDVDGLVTGYSMTEPYFMLGSVLAEYLGLKPRFCASLTVGGATPAVSLHHAAMAIVTGQANVVLVTAGENRATGQTRDAAVQALTQVSHPYFENLYGPLIPSFYAMVARRYIHEHGITREEIAQVAVQSRDHAVRHPASPMTERITVDDVLNSKTIAEPLNILDCCLISDSAGAFIVTSADRAEDLREPPAWLLGVGEYHTHEHITMAPSLTRFGAVESGQAAYKMAGLGPEDMDFAELYDCFSIVPIIEAEELGLAERGGGGELFTSGAATIEGRMPINTHGGMLSFAQAGGSGGIHAIVEGIRQLRGNLGERQVKKHETLLVHNEGGILSSHCTMVFANQRR